MINRLISIVLLLALLVSFQVNVLANDCPSISILSGYPNIVNPECGIANGSIEVLATGQGSVTYSLDGSTYQSQGLFEDLSPANYTLYIQDESGCIEEVSVPLQDPTDFFFNGFDIVPDVCVDDVGRITVLASGAGLSYSINNGDFQSSNVFSGLSQGNYLITIVNESGCQRFENAIVPLNGIAVQSIQRVNTTCEQATGSLTVNATGNGTLRYALDGGTPQTSNVFSGLPAGDYRITITDDEGCEVVRNTRILAEIDFVTETEDTICLQEDGVITITVNTSGNWVYSIDGENYQDSNVFSDLPAGSHTVYVKDANSDCNRSRNVSITELNSINIADIVITHTGCTTSEGTITIDADGDGLTYSIDGGETFSNSNFFDQLPASSYEVVVRDNLSCEESLSATVIAENSIEVNDIITSISDCALPTGTILIDATGEGQLSYSIDAGENFQTSNYFDGLNSGVYSVVISDESGCLFETTAMVAENNDISITSIQVVAATGACIPDGEIELIATGFDVEYSLDGENYQNTGLFNGLLPGPYVVYLRSSNNCVRETGIIIIQGGFTIPEIITTPTSCGEPNGILEVIATGTDVLYSLDNVTYQESNRFENLPSGDYTIYAGDGEGCFVSATATLSNEGFVMFTDATAQGTSCGDANGIIEVTAESEDSTFIEYSIDGVNYDLSNTFENLSGGVYTVYARDSFGCEAETEVEVARSAPLTAELSFTNPICADGNGEIIVHASGGVAPYEYSINGEAFRSNNTFTGLEVRDHTIEVRDASGCFFTIDQFLERNCKPAIPNVIAPNGNGRNECLQVLYWTYVDIKNYQIFHRWGELVYDARPFNSIEHTVYWDGKVKGETTPGVFLYNITFTNEHGEDITMQGNVTVIQ